MSKFRKLVLTVGALAALAVGGAAFAQAQSSSSQAPAPSQQSQVEQTSPGDTDGGQAAEQGESATEQNDGPESAADSDGPGGHHDEACADTGRETQDD